MAMIGATKARDGQGARSSLPGASFSNADGSPLFKEVMDRVAEACMPNFDKLAGEGMSVTCTVDAVRQETASDIVAPREGVTTAFFEIPAIDARLAICLDDYFLQLFVELMCGGTCAEPLSEVPRPGTSIDRQFARVACSMLNTVLAKECASFGLGGMTFGQIQAKPDAAALGKRTAKVTVVTFSIECLGRDASFHVVLPQTVVDRFKRDALPAAKETPVRVDPEWSGRLHAEISRTSVSLDAFLEADKLTLRQVASLKVGQILTRPKTAPSRCELRCDDKPLFRCELGQADGRYSLRIEEGLPRKSSRDAARVTDADAFTD